MSTFAKRICAKGLCANRRRGKRSWLRKLAHTLPAASLAGVLAIAVKAGAQDAAAPPAKSYLNKSAITLPVLLEDKYRAQLKSIQLYVKESPSSPWKLQEQAPPTQTAFTYRAPADGEYAFNIVSVDTGGRSLPADVTKEAPALVVVIDTQAPQVAVERGAQTPEGHCVKCEARDPHLDAAKTKVFYQTADQIWRDLPSQPGKADTFCVPASDRRLGRRGQLHHRDAALAGPEAAGRRGDHEP